MARLSINDVIDFAVVFLADEVAPRLQDIPGHMRQLSGGWFAPCTDVIRGRVAALEASGFVHVLSTSQHRGQRRVHATEDGELGDDARSALMLELSQHDPAMPSMADLAGDFAAIQEPRRHGAG